MTQLSADVQRFLDTEPDTESGQRLRPERDADGDAVVAFSQVEAVDVRRIARVDPVAVADHPEIVVITDRLRKRKTALRLEELQAGMSK